MTGFNLVPIKVFSKRKVPPATRVGGGYARRHLAHKRAMTSRGSANQSPEEEPIGHDAIEHLNQDQLLHAY